MKNTNKKGFTIVELVIVIAVIGILAAVLIPTFSSLIKKANESADIQATRQMNTALAVAGELNDIDDVIDALAEAGYNSKDALIPVSTGYSFVWDANSKSIVLVRTEEVNGRDDLRNCLQFIDVITNSAADLKSALNAGTNTIKLTENVELDDEVNIPAGANVTLDLADKTLTTVKSGVRSKYLNVEGTLTVVNGTIESRGIKVKAGGNLIIGEGVTIANVDNDGGSAIRVVGGNVTINGGTFTANNGDFVDTLPADYLAEPGVLYVESGSATINGGKFESTNSGQYPVYICGGSLTITDGEFVGKRGCVNVSGETANVSITGGTFKTTTQDHCVYVSYGTITIEGATFTNSGSGNVFHVANKTDDGKDCTGTLTVNAGVVYNGNTISETETHKCTDGTWTLK